MNYPKRPANVSTTAQPGRLDRGSPNRAAYVARITIFATWSLVFMLLSAWLLPFVSEFDLIGDHISELALGRYGFVQTIALFAVGLATLLLGFVLWRLTSGTKGAAVGSLLVSIYGLAGTISAIFPTDEVQGAIDFAGFSTAGAIHAGASLIGFLSVVLGMFLLSWSFRRMPEWHPVLTSSVLHAGGALALMFVQAFGPLTGLMQRLLVTVVSSWLLIIAVHSRRITSKRQRTEAFTHGAW